MKRLYYYLLLLLSCTHALVSIENNGENIAVIGTGYVGLVLGACLSKFGHNVLCVDKDATKIEQLQKGIIPIYEPGLKDLVDAGIKNKRLIFTQDIKQAIGQSSVIFIAVGTPMGPEGQSDLSAIDEVIEVIGNNLTDSYKVICTKSTVPIGTSKSIKQKIATKNRTVNNVNFDVVFNPEFLREGSAVSDFLHPDRIVIGSDSDRALEVITQVYGPLIKRNTPMLLTDTITAETIKYASNSFLAVKISYINEIARLCEATGADIKKVTQGMGLDERIGAHFLNPGPGFGGSCFPKDAQALLYKAKEAGVDLHVLTMALITNDIQKLHVIEKIIKLLDSTVKNKRVAILGLAFKAETDDVRYSPAITIIEHLVALGVQIQAYDPAAMDNMRKIIPDIYYAKNLQEAVADTDMVVILTEWQEFKNIDLALLAKIMRKPVLLDARNIISTEQLKKHNFTYDNIGNARVI